MDFASQYLSPGHQAKGQTGWGDVSVQVSKDGGEIMDGTDAENVGSDRYGKEKEC